MTLQVKHQRRLSGNNCWWKVRESKDLTDFIFILKSIDIY